MKKVILIEDNEDMLNLLDVIVKEANFQVFLFKEAKKAYESLQSIRPDLIICDLLMPEYNGLNFLKQIKSDPDFKTVPVIIISVVVERFLIDEVMSAGADAFFHKPFRVIELIDIINKYLGVGKNESK